MHWIVVTSTPVPCGLLRGGGDTRANPSIPCRLLRRSFDHAVCKIIKIDRSTNPVKDDEAGGMFWLDRIEQQTKRTDDGNPPRLMDVFFRRVPNTATDGEHVFAIIIR